jgi:hypothetical protein
MSGFSETITSTFSCDSFTGTSETRAAMLDTAPSCEKPVTAASLRFSTRAKRISSVGRVTETILSGFFAMFSAVPMSSRTARGQAPAA